jgi:PAS domain S-box-containing protein
MTSPKSKDTAELIAASRRTILREASGLMAGSEIPLVEQFDAVPKLSGIALSALEELKVAEEELQAANAALLEQRQELEERVHHYHQLFDFAPFPFFITDIYGTVQEINRAACHLLQRTALSLHRKPLATLIPRDQREKFRQRLNHAVSTQVVHQWDITFTRATDGPLPVVASVTLVPGLGATRSGLLFWMVRRTPTEG